MIINLTDKEIYACERLFERTCCIDHTDASFFGHLYNTFYILKKMNCSEDVCLAGLYHSVYGTDFFHHENIFTEEEVVEIIGEKPESMVRYFSMMKDRYAVIFENSLNLEKEILLALSEILYANDTEQSRGDLYDKSTLIVLSEKIQELRSELGT